MQCSNYVTHLVTNAAKNYSLHTTVRITDGKKEMTINRRKIVEGKAAQNNSR